jgi:Ca-activated chloride channel family protein
MADQMIVRKVRSALGLVIGALAATMPAGIARGAGLLIADGGFGGQLEIQEHNVAVTINNGIAVTEITQVFRNLEKRPVEALYTFPVPKDASVSDFSMWINGKEMTGEVVEKQRARQIYESYRPARRDPGLLEQTDYKTFNMRIFPIGPEAQQRVRIRYYQQLDLDNDWATYVYPLATVTRKDVQSRTTGTFSMTVQVKSQVPIAAAESPSHAKDLAIARHGDSVFQASMEATGGDLSRDVVIAYQLKRPQTGLDLIASKTGNDNGYFCLTLTAGEELSDARTPMDYVFILDTSGSMGEQGKFALSRGSTLAFVSALDAQDRLEVITFNSTPQTLFGKLRPADKDGRDLIGQALDGQSARGGTVLAPALSAAYKYKAPERTLNVVLLSDGMTDDGERDAIRQLIKDRPQDSRVFCIGVGNEVNRPLLEHMAEESGGLAAFLSQQDDFVRQGKAFWRKLQHPAGQNVRIDFEGLKVYDLEPQKLPNLYHGSPVRLYGRYEKGGVAKVTVRASVAGQEIVNTVDMTFPDAQDANPEIERMWALEKVHRLINAGPADTGEIVRLGEAYSIVTPYTSFLVLENDAEYQRWQIQRRNVLRSERDTKAQQAVRAKFDEIRNKSLAGIGLEVESSQSPVTGSSPGPMPIAQAPPAGPPAPPSSNQNLRWPRTGGGPVGLVGLLLAAAAAAGGAYCRRRPRSGREQA